MPWVRIDEHALNHVKLLALSHGAFRLWVEGLAHCQRHLTDGAISKTALRTFRYFSVKFVAELVAGVDGSASLWLESEDVYQVHDYLQWNEDKSKVTTKREQAKERMQRLRAGSPTRSREQMAEQAAERTPNVRDTTATTTTTTTPRVPLEPPAPAAFADARSKRPIFKGNTFVVFEWQLDDLRRLLGAHFEAFDVHGWFDSLDQQALAAKLVVPQRDGGKWLQEQTLNEASRRGLPVAATMAGGQGKTAGNLAAAARFVARGQA